MNTSNRPIARRPAAVLILGLGSLLAVAPVAAAGDASLLSLAPGMRVRIEAPGLATGDGTGTINAVDDKVVRLDVAGRAEPVTVAKDQITRLQVSVGRSSRLVHALVGAAIGAIGGAIVTSHSGGQWQFPGAKAAAVTAVALVGAGTGAALPAGERWQELPVPRYRVALVPNPAAGFALTWSRAF